MKIERKLIVLFLSIGFISCSKEDDIPVIQPSISTLEMEAEGGEAVVAFTNGDWSISEIRNQDGDVRIQGNSYSPEGDMIAENSPLSLETQGSLEALWAIKGFVITRDTPSSLKIFLKENSSGEEFNFRLILKSGQEHREILVKQKISEGYKFESIEFSLKEGDSDSLYLEGGTNYEFNIPEPQIFEFSPYGGIDVHKRSNFSSHEEDAFIWIRSDSIMVETPGAIFDGELVFNGETSLYSNSSTINPHGFENWESVTIPAGESAFSTELEWRKRQVSYELHLTNNRTGEEKVIEGKWIEVAPTGKYTVRWKD